MDESTIADSNKTYNTKSKWFTLIVTCLGVLLLNIDLFIVNVALPAISKGLHAPMNLAAWTISGYVLMIGILPAGLGRIGDIWGQKKLYLSGLTVFTTASLTCGLATNIIWLIIFRIVQGIGAAALTPGTLAILMRAFPMKQRGLAIGLNGGFGGLGLIAGPVLGGVLVNGDNWRGIFFVNIPLGILSIILTILFVAESRDETKARNVDWLGLVFLSIGLLSILFTFSRAGNNGFDLISIYFLLVGVILLSIFIFVERRTKDPLIELSLFKNVNFIMPCLSMFLFSAALFGSQPYWSLFLQNFWKFTPLQGGLAFLPATVLVAALTPFAGILSQKIGIYPHYMVMSGIVLVGLSFLYVAQLNNQSDFMNGLLPALLMRGVGIPILMTSTSLMIMNSLPDGKAGLAAGMLNMFRNIGTAIGVTLLGQLFMRDVSQTILTSVINISASKLVEVKTMAYQFILINDKSIQPLAAKAILHGFENMAVICAIAFIPALLSTAFIKMNKS